MTTEKPKNTILWKCECSWTALGISAAEATIQHKENNKCKNHPLPRYYYAKEKEDKK